MFTPPIALCLILAASAPIAQGTLKIWSPPPKYNTASEWQPIGPDPECAGHTFVYQPVGNIESVQPIAWQQNSTSSSLLAKSSIALERIVLPTTGAIILDDSAPIVLNAPPKGASRKCAAAAADDNYMLQKERDEVPYWFDPAAWLDASARTPNKARLTVNKVPCECDSVQLGPDNGGPFAPLAIRMHETDEVLVRSVQLGQRSGQMDQLMGSQVGSNLFTTAGQSAGRRSHCDDPAQTPCGCHSAGRYRATMVSVCAAVRCPQPAGCLQPIVVPGMCCPMCGARFRTDASSACPRKLLENGSIRGAIGRLMHELDGGRWMKMVDWDLSVDVQVHGLETEEEGSQLHAYYSGQLVLADKADVYEGRAVELAALLWRQPIINSFFRSYDRSGEAYSPYDRSPVATLIFGTLLLSLCAFAVAYAHYEKGWLSSSSNAIAGRWRRVLGDPVTFRRFDNVSLAGALADQDQPSTSRPQQSPPQPEPSVSAAPEPEATSFDNPLFGSQRAEPSGVQVVIAHADGPNLLNNIEETGEDLAIAEMAVGSDNLIDVELDSSETNI